jgi:SNF2 family DNA or RNA helicase
MTSDNEFMRALEGMKISPTKKLEPDDKPFKSSSVFLKKNFNSLSQKKPIKQQSGTPTKKSFDRNAFFNDAPLAVDDKRWGDNKEVFRRSKFNPENQIQDKKDSRDIYNQKIQPVDYSMLKPSKRAGNVILNPNAHNGSDPREGIDFVKSGFEKYAKTDSPFKDPYSILNNRSIERSGASFLDNPELLSAEKAVVDKLISSVGESEMEEEIKRLKEADFDEKDRKVKGLTVNLLDHQVLGLKFLKKREKEKYIHKGGLLCDDMGLGKTVQMIALIVKNKAKEENLECLHDIEHQDFQVFNKDVPKRKFKSTLVITPVGLTTQWINEVKRFAPHLDTHLFHGPNRTRSYKELMKHDVVVSSYDTIRSEFNGSKSPIYAGYWHRVVLDEAHTIKNKTTKTTIAAFNVESTRRWALTGTPIQNSVKELQSLLMFLRVSDLSNENIWKETMKKLLGSNDEDAFKLLKKELGTIMLRRTKAILQHTSFKLPTKTVKRCEVKFSKMERRLYQDLHNHFRGNLTGIFHNLTVNGDGTAESKTSGHLFSKVSPSKLGSKKGDQGFHLQALVFLLRLRQVCCHWKLLTDLNTDDVEELKSANIDVKQDPMAPPSKAPFDMDKALDDLANIMDMLTVEETKCEICFVEKVEEGKICKSCLKAQEQTKTSESAKVLKLLEILKSDPERKTIVFSQFRELLVLVSPVLKKHGIKSVMYDGQMTLARKDNALDQLRNDEETTVLLCSLKSGAVGLNLTAASQVVLFDPWWNPQIQEQAIDRVYRIGQTKPVDVHVFAVEDTVEVGILELQEKKRAVAHAVMGSGDSSTQKQLNSLSTSELMQLFGITGR